LYLDLEARDLSRNRTHTALVCQQSRPPYPPKSADAGLPTKAQRDAVHRRAWGDLRWNGKVHPRPGSGEPSKYYYAKQHEEDRYGNIVTAPHPLSEKELRRRARVVAQIGWPFIEPLTCKRQWNPEAHPAMAIEDERRAAAIENMRRLRALRLAQPARAAQDWHPPNSRPKARSAAEWNGLARRAAAGAADAYRDIVEAAVPIAQALARVVLPDVGGRADELQGDLVHVGIYGFRSRADEYGPAGIRGADPGDRTKGIWRAIDAWDENKGRSFLTFMRESMKQAMWDYLRAHRKQRQRHDWADAPAHGVDDE
jgi:hypothetical protein